MTEHDRKQEILQAEAAILQLADQLAQARQSRTAADEAAGNLHSAQVALERIRAALQETVQALQENTQRSSSVLAEAKEQLDQAQRQVAKASHELHMLSQQVGEISPTLQRLLESALQEVGDVVRRGNQGQELLRMDLAGVRRLTWAVLILSLLALGAGLTSMVLTGLRLD